MATFEDDVVRRIEEVRDLAERGDWDAAHAVEDDLHQDVLRWIAHSTVTLGRGRHLAEWALQTLDLEFPRYTS